ncbi:30S ribosomal protein S20 [Geotoga petraea]|uniref:Small ribosomal subunit protein bS20 n=1 Tax=Geotoga petraea TaxID=28234 RepID=A0A1G6K754_9BACT|nr:30S ribosomal protein S20 [Geotoga petraea]MDK2945798.1 small subunit ribosomal protein [Geotoga sp.]TGG88445.1 30S ribosomal protein S20 [Geotoga petraea]SDC26763.1 SSU ribosomal protein S20P [Geotoga petraea]
MPNTKSAKKRVLQNEKRRMRNKSVKTRIKNQIKVLKLKMETEGTEREDLLNELSNTFKVIDKAASKGIIHKRTASRKKSRLHKHVKEYLGEVAPE